ncbi:MAG: metal-dependent transcriptional regulator [Candidatus Caldarchaeum sp.]
MPKMELNSVETTYLQELYRTHEAKTLVSTGYFAKKFMVRPASAFDVIDRLVRKKLVERTGWGKFRLTSRGHMVAARIIHNHRIIETYFSTHLGLSPSDACQQASRIDYAIGDLVVKKMCMRLNYPSVCIHGNEVRHQKCAD